MMRCILDTKLCIYRTVQFGVGDTLCGISLNTLKLSPIKIQDMFSKLDTEFE